MNFEEIQSKVEEGGRISREEALYLYNEADLLELGELARFRRSQKTGDRLYYQINLNLNHTNACVLRCAICAFYRPLDHSEAYTVTFDEAERRIRPLVGLGLNEVHIVGGLNPRLDITYYESLFKRIKSVSSRINIKALTAVEVDYIARISRLTVRETLERLREAGLGSLPGGGAEIFADEVRQKIARGKISERRWSDVIREAHRLEIPSNATMLYGHVETIEHRVDHLLSLRTLQDETGGFKAFVPLPFHPENTPLDHLGATRGVDDLKTIAVARLILDNFDHVKALWIYLGVKMLPVALEFGADDVGGTSISEEIVHRAGAATPNEFPEADIQRLARDLGMAPILTDSRYEEATECVPV